MKALSYIVLDSIRSSSTLSLLRPFHRMAFYASSSWAFNHDRRPRYHPPPIPHTRRARLEGGTGRASVFFIGAGPTEAARMAMGEMASGCRGVFHSKGGREGG